MTTDTVERPNTTTVKSGRGRKPGSETKVRPPIPADQFIVLVPAADSRANFKRRREERTPEQVRVDNLVAEVHRDWVKAGKPSNWVDMPSRVWPINKQHADTAQFMLRKACTLYGRRLYSGNIEHGICKDSNCPCHKVPGGLTHIPFCVMDAREKRTKSMSVQDLIEFAEEMGVDLDALIEALSD